ncbi:hypothetical protein [Moraxella marmotae]|uniref:hypothetical protein n=1 Tax=Moraxella marmotae TaxID=3344520 RepID=UPI0035F28E9B
MKNFIKVAPLALALIIAPNAHANNNQKIAFVKKMYAEQKRVKDSGVAIQKYGTAELKQAFRYANSTGFVCIESDPFYNSQDPNYGASVSYSVNGQGHVVANVARHGRSTFVLAQAGNGYKLADIYYREGSLKNNLSNC